MHFLGHDTSFQETLWKISEFRLLDAAEQDSEMKRWNAMKRREQNLYKGRIELLIELQKKMRAENDPAERSSKKRRTMTTAAATTTNSTTSQPSGTSQAVNNGSQTVSMTSTADSGSTTVTPTVESTTTSVSTAPGENPLSQGATAEQSTNPATATDPPAPDAGDATTEAASTDEASTAGTLAELSEPPAEADPLGNLTNTTATDGKYKGLASEEEERKNALPKSKGSVSSSKNITRPRKRGLPCQDVSQQADATSMKAVHRAMLATAEAIDTTSLPGRERYAPGQTMVLFVLNKVRETSSVGGGNNSTAESRRRKHPKLTVVTSSARDVKDITLAVYETLKHTNRTRNDHGYDVQVFSANEESPEPLVAPEVKQFVKQYIVDRKNPPKTPRSWQEVQAEHAKENRRP